MNPLFLTASFIAQVALLYRAAPSLQLLSTGLGISVIFGMLCFTRLRWDAHLDMHLVMLGPGGVGMLAMGMMRGSSCHHSMTWSSFTWMNLGMWAPTLPLIWMGARCVAKAKTEGRGLTVMLLDLAGMTAGMGMAQLALARMPMGPEWLSHGIMLAGMTLGMMAASRI